MEQLLVLQRAYKNNGIAATDVEDLYSSRENAYRSLYNMTDKKLLRRVSAPPTSSVDTLWQVTDGAMRFVDEKVEEPRTKTKYSDNN